MTITMYDRFAFLPKRCSKCNRLFIWEGYMLHVSLSPDMRYTFKDPVCNQCQPMKKKLA